MQNLRRLGLRPQLHGPSQVLGGPRALLQGRLLGPLVACDQDDEILVIEGTPLGAHVLPSGEEVAVRVWAEVRSVQNRSPSNSGVTGTKLKGLSLSLIACHPQPHASRRRAPALSCRCWRGVVASPTTSIHPRS